METTVLSLCVYQLLVISAIILANLCVSYIMTSQTEEVGTLHPITCTL